jgi:hypothetical protein
LKNNNPQYKGLEKNNDPQYKGLEKNNDPQYKGLEKNNDPQYNGLEKNNDPQLWIVFFLLAFLLSVFPQYTASDYPLWYLQTFLKYIFD